MLIGYIRVSTEDQTTDSQRDALTAHGCETIYSEHRSGKDTNRPELENCLKAMRAGDTLIVWRLDRLGRNLSDLISIVRNLETRGIGFTSLTEQIDTTTPAGRLVFHVFAALAEFERELISERTKAGLAAARARGRAGGRPRKMDLPTLKMAMAAMSDRSSVAKNVAKRLNISTATLYEYVNGDGSPKEPATKLLTGNIN